MPMPYRVIAIDGPAASGKSTVARRVAAELGWLYADSGSLYRAVTWKALQSGVDPRDSAAVRRMLPGIRFEPCVEAGAVRFRLDGAQFGQELRGAVVNEAVSLIAAMPEVRATVVAWLRSMGEYGDLAMEGRDIGTAVFPDAEFKFYLDASPEERARRRHSEIAGGPSMGEVDASLKRRDIIDSTRRTAPLRAAADAVIVDTTGMTIEDVVRFVVERVREKA